MAFMQAKEEEAKKVRLASWVNEQFTKCKNARAPFERQWYLNLAFYSGKQYVSPVDIPVVGFKLTVPKMPPWRVRAVVNKIRPAIRTECAKLTTSRPIPTVVPATNEGEDYAAAAVSEQLLKTEFATAEFDGTYRSWIWWGSVTGTSFLKQYWDPTKQDYDARSLPTPPSFPNGQPVPPEILVQAFGPDILQKLQTPQPAQGKICIERVTPFHLYVPDLLCEGLEGQPYVIHVMTKSKEWVKDKFGFEPNCDTRASSTILDAASIITKGAQDTMDAVMVKEVWVKPLGCRDLPNGGVLTVINERVVQFRDGWPADYSEYPFYKYNGIPTGGFYSDSIIVDLIPIQKEYNKKRSQMIEIQNTMGKPKLLYQKGSLNPKMISSEPGQSIPYVAGYEPPTPLNGVEVPASFVNEINQLAIEFDDLSGQHEISRGQTSTPQLTSGTAIAYLQEQDDAKLVSQVAAIESAIELIGKHYLMNASKYWDDDRLVRITGKNQLFEALHWKKGMLRGNTDVRVQTGSALPFSKAAKTALITEMMQNGFIDPQSGLEVLELGGLDKLLDEALVDKRQAVRENMKMAEMPESALKLLLEPHPGPDGEPPYESPTMGPGPMVAQPDKIIADKPYMQDPKPGPPVEGPPQMMNGDGTPFQPQPPVPVNSWDNHEEHVHWHNQYRKTQEFEQLGPLAKQAFEMHVQLHQMALSSQLVNTQGHTIQDNSGMQELPPGASGGGGNSPPSGEPPQEPQSGNAAPA